MTTKEKLIESAKELIVENGYENTKVEDITKKAEVAKGTFYTYFKTKEDIFAEILKSTFQLADEKMTEIVFEKDLEKNLRLFIELMIKGGINDKRTFKIVSNVFTNPELVKVIMSMGCNFKDSFKQHIKRLLSMSKDELNDSVIKNLEYIYSPLEKFIKIYLGELMGLADGFATEKIISEEEVQYHINFLVEFLHRALKK